MNNVTSVPYRARYDRSSLVGSAGTYYHPVARWVEDKRRRVNISETFQDISHIPPYTDVIQFGQPHGLFSRNANWAESSVRGFRIPPSGAIPVVTGVSGGLPVSPFDYTGETEAPIDFKNGSQVDPELWQGFLDSTQTGYTTIKNATADLIAKFRNWVSNQRDTVYGPANYEGPKDLTVHHAYEPPKGIFHSGDSEPLKDTETTTDVAPVTYTGTKDISIRGPSDVATILKEVSKSPATKLNAKATAIEKSLRSIRNDTPYTGGRSEATTNKRQGFTPLKTPRGGLVPSRPLTRTEKNINAVLRELKFVGNAVGKVVQALGGFAPRFLEWIQAQPRKLITELAAKQELAAAAIYWVRNNAGRLVRVDNGVPHRPIY